MRKIRNLIKSIIDFRARVLAQGDPFARQFEEALSLRHVRSEKVLVTAGRHRRIEA